MVRYRISGEGAPSFVSMSVVDWLPIFVAEASCRILVESLNLSHERKGLRVNAYVIMPTHVRGIRFFRKFDPGALKAALIDLRKFTGRWLLAQCARHMPRGFDEVFVASSGADRDRRFWQATLHPEQIETEAFYLQKRDYLHGNPGRKGLVTRAEHWRFSSASYWLSDGQVANEVILTPLDW